MKKISKTTLTFILGVLLAFSLDVAAETLISSGAVSYSNSKTAETTVDGALDELFSAVDINGRLGSTYISAIGDGTVTGAISTLNTEKQAIITGGASTITSSNLTANRALVSNSSGKVGVSAVTSTELGYLDGVTSNVQIQLNNLSTEINQIGTVKTNHFDGRYISAATWTKVATISLTSGTWVVIANASVAAPGDEVTLRFSNNTNMRQTIPSNSSVVVSGNLSMVITLSESTDVNLEAYSSTIQGDSNSFSTHIQAIRIA